MGDEVMTWLTDALEWLRGDRNTPMPPQPVPPPPPSQVLPPVASRGERNNNPGNLYYEADIPYKGQLGLEVGVASPCFARFDTAHNGLRALAKTLMTYYLHHSVRTIRQDVARFAPVGSDQTRAINDAYMETMEHVTGYKRDEQLNFMNEAVLTNLVRGHVTAENGRCMYPLPMVQEAVRDALGVST